MLYGLDIASYQGTPDWGEVARKHAFMITKVTGEGSYVNPYWRYNMDTARMRGVIVGGYDWVEPQSGMTGYQAAMDFLATLGPLQPGDLLCVDFETPDWHTGPLGRDIEGFMRDYLYTLLHTANQPVIVYTGTYFLQETGASGWDWLGRDFLLWLAAPGADAMMADDSFWPAAPAPWSEVTLHQHQWHAWGGGVVGEYDRDRFRGTREELAALGAPATVVPQGHVTGGAEVQEPQASEVKTYINDAGETLLVINFGGEAKDVLGTAIVDAGVSVKNARGDIYDRSVQASAFGGWRKRPAAQ